MESIKRFKHSLTRFFKRPNDQKNQQIVKGWYRSYEALEKYAFNDVDKEQIQQLLRQQIKLGLNQPKSYRLWYTIASAAAILALVVGVTIWSHQQPTKSPVYLSANTAMGVMKYLRLSDGTAIWLNASSVLKYPTAFGEHNRTVYLPEGEAFFEVKRDEKKPFKVYVGKLEVKVLGTSFNINNYADALTQTIIVNTGKVQVSNGKKILALLIKGDQLRYDKAAGKFELSKVDQSKSFSWRDGKTILQDATFSDVAMVFKNWYGINLQSENKDINHHHYNVTIQRQISLADNLALICRMHQMNYRKEGQMVVLY